MELYGIGQPYMQVELKKQDEQKKEEQKKLEEQKKEEQKKLEEREKKQEEQKKEEQKKLQLITISVGILLVNALISGQGSLSTLAQALFKAIFRF